MMDQVMQAAAQPGHARPPIPLHRRPDIQLAVPDELMLADERMLAEQLRAEFPELSWRSDSDHRRAAVWGWDSQGRARVWAALWYDGCLLNVVVWGIGGRVDEHRRLGWSEVQWQCPQPGSAGQPSGNDGLDFKS